MTRPADQLAALQPSGQGPSLGTTALKGHGFSRAASRRRELPGFSPRGTISSIACTPSAAKAGNILEAFAARLKPCNFNTPRVVQPLRPPFIWGFPVFALAAFLAATPSRADTPAAPTTSHQRDSSLQEYRNHLLALTTLVEACAKARDTKTCDPTQVGPDDRVAMTETANPDRRLVRYGWLRVLLSQAQDKDKPPTDTAAKPDKSERDAIGIPSSGLPQPTTSQLLQAAETRLAHDLAQAGSPIAAAPTHIAEREVMRQVLAGRDFRNLEAHVAPRQALGKAGRMARPASLKASPGHAPFAVDRTRRLLGIHPRRLRWPGLGTAPA